MTFHPLQPLDLAMRKVLDVILVLLFMEFCFFLFKVAMRWFPA